MSYEKEKKALLMLYDGCKDVEASHVEIASGISEVQDQIDALLKDYGISEEEVQIEVHTEFSTTTETTNKLEYKAIDVIYTEAEAKYPGKVEITQILTPEDIAVVERRYEAYVADFDKRYGLDKWDYAIAGTCGVLAGIVDLLFVSAPLKPTTEFAAKVDGVINRGVQDSLNKILPPDLSKQLSEYFTINGADASVRSRLIGAPQKVLNPINHRLRGCAHDPVLGFIFGVLDMLRNTCTVVHDGGIKVYPANGEQVAGNVFQSIGRMLGHLLSDLNAPSGHGNRGMGLPAPFMGLLRMLDDIPVGESSFGKQIEWLYTQGYDFRQFLAVSVPVALMGILTRVCYLSKQTHIYKEPFAKTLLSTMPCHMHPKFRMLTTLAYGSFCAVNAGKVYISQNLLDANYTAWYGFAWNTLHSLRWALWKKQAVLCAEIDTAEEKLLLGYLDRIESLEMRAERLSI